jgi:hypothetical protein
VLENVCHRRQSRSVVFPHQGSDLADLLGRDEEPVHVRRSGTHMIPDVRRSWNLVPQKSLDSVCLRAAGALVDPM